jgi:hypothetical protein
MLATSLPGRLGRDAMEMPSRAGDDSAGVTWPRCDVGVESC